MNTKTEQALRNIQVWNFIPDEWEVPLGYDQVVAGAKEALAVLTAMAEDYEKVKAELGKVEAYAEKAEAELAAARPAIEFYESLKTAMAKGPGDEKDIWTLLGFDYTKFIKDFVAYREHKGEK